MIIRASGASRGLVVAVLAACSGAAPAAELFVDPLLRLSGQYDSNPRQDIVDERDSYGGLLDTALELGARGPASKVSITPRVQAYRFDDKNLDRTDDSVAAILERAFSTQWKARVDADYSNQSLLDDPDDDSTGNSRRDRRSWSATPRLTWQLGALDALDAEFSYTDTVYEEEDSAFADYDYRIATLRWIRHWTPATQGTVEAFASGFRNLDDGSQSEDLGGRLGFETLLSPTLTLLGAIGYSASDFECEALQIGAALPVCVRDGADRLIESDSGNVLGRLELRKRFSDTRGAALGYERSVGASGRGVQVVRDKFLLSLTQELSARVGFKFDGSFQQSESDVGADRAGVGDDDNDIARVQTELRYRLAEAWFAGAGYRFRYRKDEDADASESHSPFLFIAYDPKPRTVLR